MYQMKPPRPFAPGGEIAGVVDAAGRRCRQRLAEGDRVLAHVRLRRFRDACGDRRDDRSSRSPTPCHIDEAACFVLTYGTSHHALKNRAEIKPKASPSSSSVPLAVSERRPSSWARPPGQRSSPGSLPTRKPSSAATSVPTRQSSTPRDMSDRDGAERSFRPRSRKASGGEGVDVVYDAVGGDYAEPAVRALAWKGRYPRRRFPSRHSENPAEPDACSRAARSSASSGARSTMREPQSHMPRTWADLFRMYAEGKIKPRISASYPLEKAGRGACNCCSDRKVLGKVVVTM